MGPNMSHVRIFRTVDADRSRVEDDTRAPRCRRSEYIKLYARMSHAPKTPQCRRSESKGLLTQIDATRGQGPLDDASLERPRMQGFNRLCCQTALGEHNVEDVREADTTVCEHATGILTTELWFWKTDTRSNSRARRKLPQQQLCHAAGPSPREATIKRL